LIFSETYLIPGNSFSFLETHMKHHMILIIKIFYNYIFITVKIFISLSIQ
jgi:hypothetical protein